MSEEETLLEFPCQFPIKAMGKNTADFDSVVLGIVRQHVADIKEGAVKTRPSKGDKYLSVTVTIEATSKKQLDAIYQGLTDCPDVLMAL
ncbi:MAG: YbeD family protein [Methylococcaceae bacterium]